MVLKVVPPEALLEVEGCVEVVGMVKRDEIEDQSFTIGDNFSEVVVVVAKPIVLHLNVLLEVEGVWMVTKDKGSDGGDDPLLKHLLILAFLLIKLFFYPSFLCHSYM